LRQPGRWLTPVILATQEAEMRRITVENPRPKVSKTPSQPIAKQAQWCASVILATREAEIGRIAQFQASPG
jgi:hypothetical protein